MLKIVYNILFNPSLIKPTYKLKSLPSLKDDNIL